MWQDPPGLDPLGGGGCLAQGLVGAHWCRHTRGRGGGWSAVLAQHAHLSTLQGRTWEYTVRWAPDSCRQSASFEVGHPVGTNLQGASPLSTPCLLRGSVPCAFPQSTHHDIEGGSQSTMCIFHELRFHRGALSSHCMCVPARATVCVFAVYCSLCGERGRASDAHVRCSVQPQNRAFAAAARASTSTSSTSHATV